MNAPYLSIVIPTYNAERFVEHSIKSVLSFLQNQSYASEVIIVDDGSSDKTRQILAQFAGQITILHNERNSGKGYSVRRGILSANGQFVFFTDADIPFTLEPIPRFLRYLDNKEFDVVIGSRDLEESLAVMKRSWLRRVSSRIFTSFVSRIVVSGVTDTQCGIKGFRRDAARHLFSRSRINRFAFDVEVIYIAFKKNFDIKRLPVTLATDSPSTVRLVRDVFSMTRDVFKIKWNHIRGYYQ